MIRDDAVKKMPGAEVQVEIPSDRANATVKATSRSSEDAICQLLRGRGRNVEAIVCAVAPQKVYKATLKGHRAAPASSAHRNEAARSVMHREAGRRHNANGSS
jgi:hypothetical protein